jgi:hypothetical protein
VKDKVIECINCGVDGGADLQFWITVGALLIAFLALLMNFVQFREFLRRSRARARFDLTLNAANAAVDGVVRTEGNHLSLRVEVGIDNVGDLAAGQTVINVMFPRWLDVIGWCGPNGQEIEPARASVAQTSEMLKAADGSEVEASYLTKTVERVGTKPGHVLNFMCFVDVPQEGRREIPFRLKVQADEIPSDVDEYVLGLVVGVEHQVVS